MMDVTTRLPDAVQWSEGMLLSPQHLQQHDIYWNEHLRHRLDCMTPNYWGVHRLEFDPASLIKGTVHITRLACVLPDGQAIEYDANHAAGSAAASATLSKNVEDLCKTDGRPVRIWLIVPERGAAAAKPDNPERRYDCAYSEHVPDENTGDGKIPVGRLQLRLTLHADYADKPAPSWRSACPLMEVARDSQGHLRITSYHPPMLRLSASSFLGEQSLHRRLSAFTHHLWAKIDELAGQRCDDKPDEESALSTESRLHLAAARRLALCLPQLEIVIAAQHAKPEESYLALAHVVGQVAWIGANPVPLKMKPYLHEDCMPLFQEAFDYIEGKLALVNTEYEYLPFARIGDAGFARRLPANMTGEIIIELKARDGQSAAGLGRWLADARIASDDLILQVQQRRVPALIRPLSAYEIKERNLRPQAALFFVYNQKIEIDGKGAQDIFGPNQSLLIQGADHAYMPAAIVLYRKNCRSRSFLHTAPAEHSHA